MKKIIAFALGCFAAAAIFSGCAEEKKALPESVVKNLQAAYNGESNASAKYAFYAEKADANGAKNAAALFRAASKSEGIHAQRQGEVLRKYGVEPVKEIKDFEFVDVVAALEDAKKGEDYEIATMYPEFLADARTKEVGADVIEAFSNAMEAEKKHSAFYQQATDDYNNKSDVERKFMVCLVCGYTDVDGSFSSCPLCAATSFMAF